MSESKYRSISSVSCWLLVALFVSCGYVILSPVILPYSIPSLARRMSLLVCSLMFSEETKRHYTPIGCSIRPCSPEREDTHRTQKFLKHALCRKYVPEPLPLLTRSPSFIQPACLCIWPTPPRQIFEAGGALVPEKAFSDGGRSGRLGGAGTELCMEDNRVRESLGSLIGDGIVGTHDG